MSDSVVSVVEKRDRKPGSKLAKRFAELVKEEGKTPKQAAALLRVDLSDPGSYALATELQQLIKGYAAKPEVDRALVRAGRRKVALDALGYETGGPEIKDAKAALEAFKQMASDPDVGLNAPPAPLVSLNFGSIEDLLEQMDEKDVILDVKADKDADSEP
jgi:hypothetical protein